MLLVERASGVVVEERRDVGAARQASLFEPEHEHDLVPAGSGAQQIDDGDAPSLAGRPGADTHALERARDLIR